ncbi:uncharacterized protein [Rutidosis leptorrhynchoides]|uniref:uncharacterized protein isoform X2 n=1 Tax=Rutidosis leptorrhynchoides TaxID=125765 RepID=UPI003A995B6E
MPKRKAPKKTNKQTATSHVNNNDTDTNVLPEENAYSDQAVKRQTGAIRMMRDVEVERLVTAMRLLKSNTTTEQQQTSLLQFFEEHLPNLKVSQTDNYGPIEVNWKDKDVGGNMMSSFLKQMSMAFPDRSTAMPSVGGFEYSGKTSFIGADNVQMEDFVLEEPSDTHIPGIEDSMQTPGITSQRLSDGVTPKTLRLPKQGEMLLSVHGSPLGVFKENNMDAIHETEEE